MPHIIPSCISDFSGEVEQMEERTHASLMAAFFALIFLILTVGDLLKDDRLYSENEKRMLEQRPEATAENVLSGTYMEKYETYVTDQFIGRDTWVMLKTRGDVLMNKSVIRDVYRCEDDYLIERHLPQDIDGKEVSEKLKDLNWLVQEYGAKAMLVPTADNILTDKLPIWAEFYDQKAFLAEAAEVIGEENLINVYGNLKAHADEYIYYRTDHHWTSLGAYYGYLVWKAQTDATAVETFQPDQMMTVTEEFLGTLQSKQNLPHSPDEISIFRETLNRKPKITYDFSVTTESFYESKHLATKNKYAYFLDDNHPFAEIETGYRRGRNLILIKDSYANCMVPMLANHYDRIYMIDLRYYNGSLPKLLSEYKTPETDVLVLYDCIHFIEDFKYYR